MIGVYTRPAKTTGLKPYCHHSKESDYMEVTEWVMARDSMLTYRTKKESRLLTVNGNVSRS